MKILISGYGKMGKEIEKIILSRNLDYAGWSENICETPDEIARESVCIDFTTPAAFKANYRFIAEHFGAAVIGTTGWNDMADEIIGYFKQCGTPMIYASNFSIGVNVLFAASQFISQKLAKFPQYSPSIDETHHIHKLDAPSGTAKSMAEIVECAMQKEVPVTSHREGEVPGTHVLQFESAVDRIVLSHEAFGREGFATGAVEAAVAVQKLDGVYDFKDIIFQ
ncbi:MAG: 4-hydroxy-tetrahydrodipicolinate reductase [Bacteroidales bacterium]|nr:4-hydroxy-tetrahydrodipicolinate reductase [Bacteroidales bacterium]